MLSQPAESWGDFEIGAEAQELVNKQYKMKEHSRTGLCRFLISSLLVIFPFLNSRSGKQGLQKKV